MKRFLAITLATVAISAAFAQAGFTIRTPVDGSTVREMVTVRIPGSSIPDTGFVGIWINGQFIEAVGKIPGRTLFGGDFVYKIDTKGRQIPDGKLKVEAVLYADAGESTRVLGRTSTETFLDNRSSIRVPEGGFVLRYNLKPGNEYIYNMDLTQTISNTTETQIQMNREQPNLTNTTKLRYKYTVVNTEKNPAGGVYGTLMMTPITPPGKDYLSLILPGESELKRYTRDMMHPIYMKITDYGFEKWGNVPFYSPPEGTFGEPNRTDLYGVFVLPLLPKNGVRANGRDVPMSIQTGTINFGDLLNQRKFTNSVPAQGRVLGIEFERGLRCVKVGSKLAIGAATDAQTQSLEETYWFALDLGAVIKVERKETTIMRVKEEAPAAAAGSGGGGGGGPKLRGAAGGGGGGGSSATAQWTTPYYNSGNGFEYSSDIGGNFWQGRPGRPGGTPGSRPGGGPQINGTGGGGPAGGGNTGGGRNRARLMKVTQIYTMTLE